jgi:energy-coupling factor transport system permease protein
MAIQYIPGNSFMHRLDPRTKLAGFVVLIFPLLSTTDPALLTALLVGVIAVTIYVSKVPFERIGSLLKGLLPLYPLYFFFNLWMNPISVESGREVANVLFYLIPAYHFVPVTPQGLLVSLAMLLRFIAFMTVWRIITLITPLTEIVLGLVKLKLPAAFAVAMSIGLGFVPVFLSAIKTIQEAQRCRGWEGFDSRNIVRRFKAVPALLIPVVLYGMKCAQDIAIAIEARGFGYDIGARTYRRDLHFRKEDYAAGAVMISLIIFTLVLRRYGWTDYTFSLGLLGR